MTVFPGFDRIRIINLPSRKDRRTQMIGELRRVGIEHDPRIEFVDGVTVSDPSPFRSLGERGCFLSHLKILGEAATAGESVLIVEDDADFTPGAADWAVSPKCDIAYGGYHAIDPGNLQNSDIIGSHCMGFSARAAKALVPFLEGLLEIESPPPIDGAYIWFRRQKDGFRTEFAEPAIAVQRPSPSDVATRRMFDRIPVLRSAAALARSFKRDIERGRWTFGFREAVILSLVGVAIGCAVAYRHLS